jgi:hypothetical protein
MSCLLLACALLFPQTPPSGPEVLNYVVNWPSGLSLGEARLEARQTGDRSEFTLTLEAALPGFTINDHFRSLATQNNFCSLEFEKQSTHGKRKANERTAFDLQKSLATRETLAGGGKSEIPLPACPKDALTFLYYVRRELSQGRLPPAQTVFFGAAYQVRLDYGGTQNLRLGESKVEADRLLASLKGPASQISFEVFFAHDPVRTPVLIRVPFPMGAFSMELVR